MKVATIAISVVSATLATAAIVMFVSEHNARLEADGRLAQASADLSARDLSLRQAREAHASLAKSLDDSEKAHQATRSRLEDTAVRLAETTQKLGLAQNLLKLRDDNERTLNREIASLNQNLANANTRLTEMDALRARGDELEQALALARNPNAPDGRPTQASTQAPRKILAVGPQDSFLIVNCGTKHQTAVGQRLLIRRGTNLIGTALISTTLEDVSIAQVDPHSLREALHPGDAIVLAP